MTYPARRHMVESGDRLRGLILDRYKNVSEFSRATGVKYSLISKLVNGDQRTSVENIVNIANALGMSPDLLVRSIGASLVSSRGSRPRPYVGQGQTLEKLILSRGFATLAEYRSQSELSWATIYAATTGAVRLNYSSAKVMASELGMSLADFSDRLESNSIYWRVGRDRRPEPDTSRLMANQVAVLSAHLSKSSLTRSELAEKVGVTVGAIGHWMTGRSGISQIHIPKLAKAFKVEEEYLRSALSDGL